MTCFVFDDLDRTDVRYARQGEQQFDYLNKSARPIAAAIRATVEEWIVYYPQSDRDELITRLKGSDVDHHSAFFELALHELLRRRGHKIVAVHPTFSQTENRPDYLAETANGHRYVLEALMVTGRSDKAAIKTALIDQAIRIVDDTPSPYHRLFIRPRGIPSTTLTLSKLRKQLAAYTAGLPATDAADHAEFKYKEHGFTLTARPVRRSTPATPTDRTLGGISSGAHWAQDTDDTRVKLKKKINRYGDLGLPYIVAINRFKPYHMREDCTDVLFGSPLNRATIEGYSRNRDGLLLTPQGPQNRRLSATLCFEGLTPWTLDNQRVVLIANPWATHQLPTMELGVDNRNVDALGVANTVPGMMLMGLLEIKPTAVSE